jgi:hypothetical protein
MQGLHQEHSSRFRGRGRFNPVRVSHLSGASLLSSSDRGLPWSSTLGRDEEAAGLTMDLDNNTPPYRHWHTYCAACGRITLARPSNIPGPIAAIEPNPTVKCQHCSDVRQYLTSECFLAPLSAAGTDKPIGALAVVAGLIAAVKLAKVESQELQSRSPRVRSAIADAVTLARLVVEAVRK